MYERLQFHNIDIYTQLLPVLDPAIDIYIHKYYLYLIQL